MSNSSSRSSDIQWLLILEILKMIHVLVISLVDIIKSGVQKDPIPYHTSVLSGYHWVLELLAGHPEHIQCELRVHMDVFLQLVTELWESGLSDSRNVMLEEQLAIFLYNCVTGLTVRHVGEWFQRSNETISRSVGHKQLLCSDLTIASYQTLQENLVYPLQRSILYSIHQVTLCSRCSSEDSSQSKILAILPACCWCN